MKTVVHNKRGKLSILTLSMLACVLLNTACQKSPSETAASTPETPASNAPMPTGLVKNPVKHSDTADVTKWMDMASNKTAAQIAKEEKAAKEAKDAKAAADAKALADAKAAADAKLLASKAREPVKVAPAVVAAPVATKPVDIPPPVVAAAASKAAPTPAPVAAAATENNVLKVVSSVQPKYPNGAVRAGVTSGVVSARVHIDADGKVSQVDIVKANPPKHFDKEVIAAASQWKYAPISKPQTTMLEFNFKLDN
ncbi:energy transducer TonB [Undibacterium sp. Di26W]|uniref:energy transducer TonB n=1 Tax=Undibacterium sp. Di26W TaxID=3413035 RepID=UPI003BF1AD3E